MDALRPALMLLAVATLPFAAVASGEPQPAVSPPGSAAPAVPPDAPDQAMMQNMEQRMRAQMATVLAQMRASQFELRRDVLAILTPTQRAFVATTIGELAVSAQRDDAAAAARIDAALSPAQRQTILQIVATNMARRATAFQQLMPTNEVVPEALPTLAQHIPPQPLPPQQQPTHALPIVAAVGMPYTPFSAPGQPSAGSALLSILATPIAQPLAPPPTMTQPH